MFWNIYQCKVSTKIREIESRMYYIVKWIVCGLTLRMAKVINENMKYLSNLTFLNLNCKNNNKIDNNLESDGCDLIFRNAKYVSNLEILCLECKK